MKTPALTLTLIALIFQSALIAQSVESLYKAAPFPIGVGISDRIHQQSQDWPLLKTHFNYLTPENCMKPDPLQRSENQWRWEAPDAFVNFALSNDFKVVGHCLVWAKDDRTPPWFATAGGEPVTPDLLLQRMKTHIDTLVGRYRGKIAMWDVVNEALDDGTNYLRPSIWSSTCGEDFIVKAFEYAHAADPNAILIYNDYNNELPNKLPKMIRLIESLRDRKVPLHAIGLQGHYELDSVPFDAIEKTLSTMKSIGMKVVVSELDIDVIPRGRWWANGGTERETLSKVNPYKDGCPPEILQRQAEQYARLFQIFSKYSDQILRITFWNLHDGQSWLNYFPWQRVNHPLLFDRNGQPKPAFDAVLRELKQGS
jgi:endo-1,4-beta-xylanase